MEYISFHLFMIKIVIEYFLLLMKLMEWTFYFFVIKLLSILFYSLQMVLKLWNERNIAFDIITF